MTSQSTALWKQANSALQQGKLTTAENCLSEILQHSPTNVDALRLQGIIAAKRSDFAAATHYFRQAISLQPDNYSLYNDLGLSLTHQQCFSDAEKVYLSAINKYPCAEVYNNLASLYYKQQNFNQAKSMCQKAIQLEPNYLAAHYNLALSYMQLEQFADARVEFEKVLALSPTHGHAHFHLANLFMQNDELEQAQQHYQNAISLQPALVNAYANLAATHLKQHKLDDACAYYKTALDLDPNSPGVHFNMGVIYAEQGNLSEAIIHYKSALEQQPEHVQSLQNIAACYYQQGNATLAISHYEKALAISPDNPTLSYLLSAVKQDNSQLTAPIAYIKQLFNKYASDYDQHLQSLLCYQVPTQLAKLIVEAIKPKSDNLEILDLGCGTGLMGTVIKPYAQYLLGVDIATNMLEKAEEKAIYHQLICADIKTFVMQCDQHFDLITAADVLGYIGDLDILFANLSKLFKQNGLFAFSIETAKQADFQLQPTGRFQHSTAYIHQLAQRYQFNVINEISETIRLQQGLSVDGVLFLLKYTGEKYEHNASLQA